MPDVFQYLPNFGKPASVSFAIPMSVHKTDYNKEQRHTTSNRETVLYGQGNSKTFYRYESTRTYKCTYTEMGNLGDFQILNRLRVLRGAAIYLPFFLEPLASTTNLGGQTLATLDSNAEMPATLLKFMSPVVVRISFADKAFYEVRTLANTYQDVLNNNRIQVTSAWTASLHPGSSRLYFADTVYLPENLPRVSESDKIHEIQATWQSL